MLVPCKFTVEVAPYTSNSSSLSMSRPDGSVTISTGKGGSMVLRCCSSKKGPCSILSATSSAGTVSMNSTIRQQGSRGFIDMSAGSGVNGGSVNFSSGSSYESAGGTVTDSSAETACLSTESSVSSSSSLSFAANTCSASLSDSIKITTGLRTLTASAGSDIAIAAGSDIAIAAGGGASTNGKPRSSGGAVLLDCCSGSVGGIILLQDEGVENAGSGGHVMSSYRNCSGERRFHGK